MCRGPLYVMLDVRDEIREFGDFLKAYNLTGYRSLVEWENLFNYLLCAVTHYDRALYEIPNFVDHFLSAIMDDLPPRIQDEAAFIFSQALMDFGHSFFMKVVQLKMYNERRQLPFHFIELLPGDLLLIEENIEPPSLPFDPNDYA